MKKYSFKDILGDCNTVDAFILYRRMEEWCENNVPHTKWKLDNSSTMDVYGVDIPWRIMFNNDADSSAFFLTFCTKGNSSLDTH